MTPEGTSSPLDSPDQRGFAPLETPAGALPLHPARALPWTREGSSTLSKPFLGASFLVSAMKGSRRVTDAPQRIAIQMKPGLVNQPSRAFLVAESRRGAPSVHRDPCKGSERTCTRKRECRGSKTLCPGPGLEALAGCRGRAPAQGSPEGVKSPLVT